MQCICHALLFFLTGSSVIQFTKAVRRGTIDEEFQEEDVATDAANNTSRVLTCSPVCLKCGDGHVIEIVRQMSSGDLAKMLAKEAAKTVVVSATTVGTAGVGHIGYGIGHFLTHAVNAAVNKGIDKGTEKVMDMALDAVLLGEDVCKATGVLSTFRNKGLDGVSIEKAVRLTVPPQQYLEYQKIDAIGEGARGLETEQIMELDVWRKNIDDLLYNERSEEGARLVPNLIKSSAEAFYTEVELPWVIEDVLDSEIFCKKRGGLKTAFSVGASWTLFQKEHTLTGLFDYCNNVLKQYD